MPISSSVGAGGINKAADVAVIQAYLNIARRQENLPPIEVDGVSGGETIGAIRAFQKAHSSVVDGRVDLEGPTIRLLESIVLNAIEPQLRTDLVQTLDYLHAELDRRKIRVSDSLNAKLNDVAASLYALRGGAAPGSVRLTIYYPSGQSARFQLAAAPLAAPAAAAAAEAALLALMACIIMLMLIQMMPHISKSIEDLLRRIQVLMAQLLDTVKEAIRGIEEYIRNNPKDGMRCSDAVIKFRQLSEQIIDALTAPRPADELGRARQVKQTAELAKKWQEALRDLMRCLGLI